MNFFRLCNLPCELTLFFVLSQSYSAWCSHRTKCRTDSVVHSVHKRIEMVTGIPANHSEDFQILKYEPGQFYRQHHDYIGHQRDRRSGPRMLTFFLYLSDVEEGKQKSMFCTVMNEN